MASAAAKMAPQDPHEYVLRRYEERIAYYWKTSRHNKRLYKTTRYLTVVLGALVTLTSSLAAADFIKSSQALSVGFAVATPLMAAVLAMVGGVTQAFQWGAAWSDGVITAHRLERERNRIAVATPGAIDAAKELKRLDDLVLAETEGFFARLFGSGGPEKTHAPGEGA